MLVKLEAVEVVHMIVSICPLEMSSGSSICLIAAGSGLWQLEGILGQSP